MFVIILQNKKCALYLNTNTYVLPVIYMYSDQIKHNIVFHECDLLA